MARTVRDTNLGSRATRERLKSRGKPYWRALDQGLHIGYRRLRGASGKWVVRHYAGGRTYVTETIATADDISDSNGADVLSFAEAQAKARAWRDEHSRTKAGITGPYTVDRAMADYMSAIEGTRKSADAVGHQIRAFISKPLGKIEVSALTADKVREWHKGLSKLPPRLRTKKDAPQAYAPLGKDEESKRRRQSSANRTMMVLKAALNHAFNEGKVASNAAWKRAKPFKGVDAARIRYLTVAEAKRLTNACPPDFRNLVQAALETGCRYGELARLQVHDFNPDVGTLAIRISKTARSRHVILTDEGRLFFQQICAGRAGHDLMLPRADGNPWGRSHQDRHMKEAVDRAKITPRIAFHGLRHTWASLAVMSRVPLLVVAKNLGHTDTRMVEKHYGHLAPSYIADAIRAGAPRFGFKPDKKVVGLTRVGARQ
jgi:integrase